MIARTELYQDEPLVRLDPGHRWTNSVAETMRPTWYSPLKALMDYAAAGTLLLLTLPVMLIAALLVKLTSPGPVLYSQTRVGRRGQIFTIWKIRTMRHNCEALTGPRWASTRDPRITTVGWYLRRFHIDELPQLWNVLRGEMSMIGPRPERPEFIPQLAQAIPHYRDRLLVLPGLSGLAQIQLAPETNLDTVRTKIAYDLYYIQNISLRLELRIVIGTLLHLMTLPFCVVRVLALLPRRETVEDAYLSLGPGRRTFATLPAFPYLASAS